jgi:hypothetical protein
MNFGDAVMTFFKNPYASFTRIAAFSYFDLRIYLLLITFLFSKFFKTSYMPAKPSFLALINNRAKARLFLLRKLPAAFVSGVRIESANAERCVTSVPFKWFTQNPFRSTYFACLSMAAELSTGALAMAAVYGRTPPVSLLITGMEARFLKKAVGKTFFTCNEGLLLKHAVEEAIATGAAQTVTVSSTGVDASGNLIAAFAFTWSFKARL